LSQFWKAIAVIFGLSTLGVGTFLALTYHATSAVNVPEYTAGIYSDAPAAHDGRLRWAAGVQNVQVVRSAADNPGVTDGSTTIYRHHPFIAYWGDHFWVMHDGAEARVSWSMTGLDWSPEASSVIFDSSHHHRAAFYIASNGRFLASHWVGTERGAEGTRLVREIMGPNAYGDVYTIKANHAGLWPMKKWPLYTTSPDHGFVAACDELLNDRLYRQQWQEEDRDPEVYTISLVNGNDTWKAFSWYRLADKRIVGSWKGAYMTVSTGPEWTPGAVPDPVRVNSFGFNRGAKVWGSRTEDGRYAMIACVPGTEILRRRWPLVVTTSDDGMTFDTPYLVIAGDIPIQRYEDAAGDDKNTGPQYVRGISPGNGNPPGTDLWLTYSMNKEDIWVARVPAPVVGHVTADVHDTFDSTVPGHFVPGWNTYSPLWAPVAITEEEGNGFVRLEDRDPFDYAGVMRVFPQSGLARVAFRIRAHQTDAASAPLEIDVVSANGNRAVTLALNPGKGQITARNGDTLQSVAPYSAGDWINIEIAIDGTAGQYDLHVNGEPVLEDAAFLEEASDVERIVFRTGAFRLRDRDRRPYVDEDLLTDRIPGADVLQPASLFDLDDVVLEKRMP